MENKNNNKNLVKQNKHRIQYPFEKCTSECSYSWAMIFSCNEKNNKMFKVEERMDNFCVMILYFLQH